MRHGEEYVKRTESLEEDEFYLKIAQALSGCQLVEQYLKLYIAEAFELVTKCINNRMIFKMEGKDYDNSSLERLIEIFKKFTENQQLVTELNAFKKERNFLSHKGITHCLDYEEELSSTAVAEFDKRLENIKTEATRLQTAIYEELGNIRVELDFFGLESCE